VELVNLYAISIDASGERGFSYWRDTSAARELFELPDVDAALAEACEADLLGFSLISLAILPETGRERLLALAHDVRGKGGHVAFDGNYRARLWPSAKEAACWRDRGAACADIGLPTLEDETALGLSEADTVGAHWQELGCREVVIKLGERGCRLPDGRIDPPPSKVTPVDTSGAGDAFNAGYLDARGKGTSWPPGRSRVAAPFPMSFE